MYDVDEVRVPKCYVIITASTFFHSTKHLLGCIATRRPILSTCSLLVCSQSSVTEVKNTQTEQKSDMSDRQ